MTGSLRIVLRFIGLMLLQVLVLNNMGISGYLNPFLYVLFIISLPFRINGWLLLILSFLTGFVVDVFSHTGGIHAAASVFMGYIRPGLVRLYFPKEDFAPEKYPNLETMGFRFYFGFAGILTVSHHILLFVLETFSFLTLGSTLIRALISSVVTLVLIFIYQYLFHSK